MSTAGTTRPWRRVVTSIVTGALAASAMLLTTAPAQADSIWGGTDGIIINVQTGAKNFNTRQQWVSSIYIQVQADGCGRFESWTQGFYATAERCETAYWTINRWVSSGNSVCGAFDDFDAWPRRVACIAIRV